MILGKPIAKGNTAEIYPYDKNQMIKVFHDHLPETEAGKEAFKQKAAYSYGLAVPEVIDLLKVNGKQAILMEYVNGRTLGDLYLNEPEHAEEYLKDSIETQQKIHSITPESLEAMSDKLKRQIESVAQMSLKQKSYLVNKLESMTFENRLCHGDFHLNNLIMADEKVYIIDWVDASIGDPRADVYRTFLLYSQFSKELAESYITLYCETSGLSRTEVLEWAPIIAGARLSEHVSTENENRLWEIVNDYCPF
ncbi:phosphotransferase family protein [Bacillus sp. SCS-153A]|uniref:phosphotransferase family protein n=1 Tax=Rossellomorea sedimentorum TaxID=3115294 RepID=UPI003906221D